MAVSAGYAYATQPGGIGADKYYENIRDFVAKNPDPKVISSEAAKYGVSQEDIAKAVQPAASPGYAYATQPGGIGADKYYENIRNFVSANPDPGAISTAAAKYGVSPGDIYSALGSSTNKPNTNYQNLQTQYGALQKQLAEMQSQYDRLVAQYGKQGGLGTGGIVGGGLVDDGSTLNPGQTTPGGSNLGNTGKVYGPDGKEYSSAAAALAAGVTNFTFAPPQLGPGLISGADTLGSQFLQPAAATGSANPGANIANQNLQLFQMGAPKVALPGQIPNPFAAR